MEGAAAASASARGNSLEHSATRSHASAGLGARPPASLSVTNVDLLVSWASGVPCENPAAEHSAMRSHASSGLAGRLASLQGLTTRPLLDST
jgi:hypothetical protein